VNWYLADLVGAADGDVTITTHLVEARDAEEAYAKAIAIGEDSDGFVGLHDLTLIQEPLVDGAELGWQSRRGEDAGRLVVNKGELGIFGAAPTVEEGGGAGGNTDLRPPRIVGIAHAQIMIPPGGEAEARRFYGELLGLTEIEKPEPLRARGGLWMQAGDRQLHIGVESPGVERTATRAHVAYEVVRLDAIRARLERAGVAILDGEPVPGLRRFELRDPFGNRVELVERVR
jgi:catechol 2,3-dioxygenase-like lactoylglutathione lyase family enzyme